MRWWRLPGGCFFRGSFLDAEGLPAFEKILPGVGTGEDSFVIAQVESRWIERWLYVRPLERHGEGRFLAAAHRVRRNHGGRERHCGAGPDTRAGREPQCAAPWSVPWDDRRPRARRFPWRRAALRH